MIYLIAILLPPLALIIRKQYKDLPINIVLSVLGWLPGVIHAYIVILRDIKLKRIKYYNDVQKQAEQMRQEQEN